MCIKGEIRHESPLSILSKNPYAFNILRKDTDFIVDLIDTNNEDKFCLFRKRYDDTIGYVLFIERDELSLEEIKSIYNLYKNFVGKYSKYNFSEFEMVIITKKTENIAIEFIREYNEKYSHRFPISIIINTI